ncbi:UDP-2,3-diacylglucosamine diphosphatase [Gammaproteobacteria bacterium]|nr:UDP-2,3-diacylglucosamine diphosphatase [Gammaproteobacteria bacterium]MDC1191143.1 UDP-2,3-diacylglucosamine diphosphatase [Gammaproteobacteria bacterium]
MKPRFISDIHLSDKHPELTQAFYTFLKESKEACTHLFILGDLFEAWIGDDDSTPLIQEIKSALREFTTNGPETFFIHGNRDFLIGQTFAEETGITLLPDPYSLVINEQKIVISHGDFLCTDDVDYITFRNQVRTQEWQSDFLQKPLSEREAIAASMRDASQEATAEKSNTITDVNLDAVNSFIDEHKADLFIHGHTHRPDIHNLESAKRIVLGDWGNSGWYCWLDKDSYQLEQFSI